MSVTRKFWAALCATALVAGCETSVQTSSGADYLSSGSVGPSTDTFDADAFAAAASVEPLLAFPARIGIARIEGGQLTAIPAEEQAAWEAFTASEGEALGTVVPVNLLTTAMVLPPDLLDAVTAVPPLRMEGSYHTGARMVPAATSMRRARTAVDAIRLGAARQHLDAVLVYEVSTAADTRGSRVSLADLTILGAFTLPGTKVDAVAHVEAILVDVRNGYPYLTTSRTVDRAGLAASARRFGRADDLKAAARQEAVEGLIGELGAGFETLQAVLPGPAKS